MFSLLEYFHTLPWVRGGVWVEHILFTGIELLPALFSPWNKLVHSNIIQVFVVRYQVISSKIQGCCECIKWLNSQQSNKYSPQNSELSLEVSFVFSLRGGGVVHELLIKRDLTVSCRCLKTKVIQTKIYSHTTLCYCKLRLNA